MKVLDLLKMAGAYLKKRGVESPRTAAEILLAHVLDAGRIDLYLRYDQPLTTGELERFRDAVARRAKGEPTAYIVGEKEFWGMPFLVNRNVLIPRPETEHLVEAALGRLSGSEVRAEPGARVLDLGTGSGAVVVSVAKHAPNSIFFASDISLSALQLAQENAARHRLEDRIAFVRGDWLSPFKDTRTRFDLILSNPPYVPAIVLGALQPEIQFEPRQALDGGSDGLDAVRRIIAMAHVFMNPGGILLLEIGYDQKTAVETIVRETERYRDPEFIRDYSGRDRIVSAGKR